MITVSFVNERGITLTYSADTMDHINAFISEQCLESYQVHVIEAILDLSAESKAYYHAYEITGDESLLLIAHQLEMDAAYLEVL